MDLDLAAIRAFVAVVDDEQFGHAATALGISQQAVSKRIAKLETQVGAALLARGSGRTAPTDAGARLLPHARTMLAACAEAVAAVHARPRPLRVAVFAERIAPIELMRNYFALHPTADVELVLPNGALYRTEPATDSAAADFVCSTRDFLVDGRVDAAFARAHGGPRPLPGHISACPAYREPLHLLVGREHPLAHRSSATLDEIVPYTAWVPGAVVASEWADFYRELTAFSGIVVETGSHPDGFEKMVDRVATSASMVTFVGDGGRTPWHPHSRQLTITDPTPAYPWSLLWSTRNDHPALPPLIEYFAAGYTPDSPATYWVPDSDRVLFTRGVPSPMGVSA
ncbi:LysR family transcriptional regulator [Nocardia callitridis]|uniref:LysR family transcriptional regulator n=1 Tax=Nocardia callitridis TaxID=648753 RepID=A0ABP9K8Y5_9NOCA